MESESFRKKLQELTPDEVTKKLVQNIVIHHYIGQDRARIITDDEDRRWTEVQNKAAELGIIEHKRFER